MNIATVPDSSTARFETSSDKNISFKETEAMSSTHIIHSNYVPAQVHRQLQFVDHNAGTCNHILEIF